MEYKIFGCKVNKYYTDEWLNSQYLKDKSGVFIASCVVTDNAKRKWIKFVKETAKQIDNDKKIYISGCWAFKSGEVQDDFFDIYPELDYLRWKIEILWEKPDNSKSKKIGFNNNFSLSQREYMQGEGLNIKDKLKSLPQIYTRKYLLIQWWCDSYCTFCLTVKKRWKHYYRNKEDIVAEILDFENNWWKEVVLTWVNLSAWWLENTNPPTEIVSWDRIPSRFAELLEYILKNTKIPRIRISSMWPEFIDEKCLELFKETRINPHFHYSVQSGSSNILKSMHRHYDWKYIKDLLEKTINLKRNDSVEVSIWADLIVWFPWETEEDFLDTYNLVKEWLITKTHIFPFSPHTTWETVPAWSFPNQLSDKIKTERSKRLENIWEQVRNEFIKRNIWKQLEVLLEVVKNDEITWITKYKWWSQNYIEIDNSNFKIISWDIKRNEVIRGVLV